jgi:hypothetical protein
VNHALQHGGNTNGGAADTQTNTNNGGNAASGQSNTNTGSNIAGQSISPVQNTGNQQQ